MLLQSGCTYFLGTHPFSKMPKSSGKLDKTPEVLILRGQGPTICSTGTKTKLVFFIHLKWMPAQDVYVSANGGPETNLHGTSLTVNVNAASPRGMLSYHTLSVRVGSKTDKVTTGVIDCGGLTWGVK